MEPGTLDLYDIISITISVGSAVVALISIYYGFLKRGRLVVPPIRMYRIDPHTYSDKRSFKVTLPITFMNTGAVQKVVPDLRISFQAASQRVVMHWQEEVTKLPIFVPRGTEEQPVYPFQPTLSPYESIARIYGFRTSKDDSDIVKSLEAVEGGSSVAARLELRTEEGWTPLQTFTLHYSGSVAIEDRYDRINP